MGVCLVAFTRLALHAGFPEDDNQIMNTTGNPTRCAAMALLEAGIPLTLLIDLAFGGTPAGPTSEEVAAVEGGDASWLREWAAHAGRGSAA